MATQEGRPLGSMIVELGMDGTNFGKSLDSIKKQMKVAQSSMKANMAVLGDAGDEYGKLGAKVDGLSNILKVNEKQIDELRDRHKKAIDTYGEGSDQVAKLATQINAAVTKQSAWTRQLRESEIALKQMAEESKKAASKLTGVQTALDKIKDKSKGIGEGLTKAFTAPIAAVGAFSTSVALEMDRVEMRIKTMIDTTKESAREAMDNINSITNSGRGESRESNAEAYSQTQALTGLKGAKATDFTKLALDVSSGTGYESKEVIATMNTFMKKYDMTAKEAANHLIQLKQVGVEELDETREYMPLLKDKGITPEEYAGALKSGLQAGGWSADKIQDFMKEGAIRLDSEDRKTYKDAGISKEYDSYASGKTDYKEFLAAVQKSLEGKSNKEQKQTWAAVSGTQGEDIDLGTITAIVNSEGLKVDSNAAKNLQKDIDSMPITKFNAAWAKFKQDFEPIGDTLLNIGTSILPPVSSALSKLNSLFNNLSPNGQKVAVTIGLIAAASGPALVGFGMLAGSVNKVITTFRLLKIGGKDSAKALSNAAGASRKSGNIFKSLGSTIKSLAKGSLEVLKTSLKAIGKVFGSLGGVIKALGKGGLTVLKVSLKAVTLAMRGLNLAMRANPIGFVITAIQLLVAGLIYAYNHSEKFRKIVNKAFDALKKGGKVVANFAGDVKNKFLDIKNSVSKRVADLKNSVVKYMGDLKDGSIKKLNTFLDFFKKLPGKMGDALTKGKKAIFNAAKGLGNKMIEGIEKGVNGAIRGVNWILKKVGSDKEISSWPAPKFARGTGPEGHKGGLMVVGDGGERELVRMPNGQTFLSPAKDTLVNAPKGTHVFSGKQTREIMGNVPRFKNGTLGDIWDTTKNGVKKGYDATKSGIKKGYDVTKDGVKKLGDLVGDIWDYAENPKKLLNIVVDKFANLGNISGAPLDMAKGAVTTIKNNAIDFVKKAFDSGGGGEEPTGSGVKRWKSTVKRALSMVGLPTTANYVNAWLRQIQSESGGNPKAVQGVKDINSGGNEAVGLVQVIPGTFAAYRSKSLPNDRKNGLASLYAGMNYAKSRYGKSGMLNVIGHGHGYENGGLVNQDQIARIAENNKPEMIIPLQNSKRGRAIQLLNQAQNILGVTPEKNGAVNSSANYEAMINKMGDMINLLNQQNQYLSALLNKNANVYLDPKDLYKATKQQKDKETIINNLARGI